MLKTDSEQVCLKIEMDKEFEIVIANKSHLQYVDIILNTIEEAAKIRGTGIAKRSPEYLAQKILEGKAILALDGENFAGFCYIETWGNKQFVANSGLIVVEAYRQHGLAKQIKKKAFKLSRRKFPEAKLFGLTTSSAVMKINYELGYRPVTYAELTDDEAFWKGCQSCVNYPILAEKNRRFCMCTAMLYDPKEHKKKQASVNPDHLVYHTKKINNNMKEKVVLAFSGGLDTSFCVKYLSIEKNFEVYTAVANTGGFSQEDLEVIEEKALRLGAVKHVSLDITREYYEKSIKYMVFGNVLRNGTYPISVSSERIFQAIAIIEYAKSIGAKYVAHGSTGAGNDQVRFDLTFQILAPEIQIITPTRDMVLTREYEIDYLKKHGYQADFTKMEYSINKGLWGTSIGGKETLHSEQTLPESAYPSQITKEGSEVLCIDFYKGEISGVNGTVYTDKVKAIQKVEEIASAYGIGRDMHIGDTIIGIKGRVGFEAAAPILIIQAHKMLEKHTLTKWQQYWKDQLGTWYGMFLHEAQYLEPVMRDMEAFLCSSQDNVSGKVNIKLRPYSFSLIGVDSPYDLMKTDFGEYGEVNKAWDANDMKGFTKILGNQMKIYYNVQDRVNKK